MLRHQRRLDRRRRRRPRRGRVIALAVWEVGFGQDALEREQPDRARTCGLVAVREWRAPHDVSFGWADVKFLIVPAPDWAAGQAHQYGVAYGEEYAQHFAAIPTVAIDATGRLLYDGSGIWTGNNP
jgi:hypothetical protein